ncbi:MAG: Hsp70 family protein, partial [Polyangiales bacterium]
MSDPIVGIDLGTSNSVVAHADEAGNVRVLADEGGYKIHPSVDSFHPNGGVVVGAAAKQRKVIDPSNTIYSVKRLIGRAYSSPEVKTAKKRSPFQIKEGANELPLIVTRGGEFAVPEISAIVLDHVRNIAQHQLGEEVARAVVTVPASFNDAQRSATATAGAIAGLTVVRVLNEPTAAALAYGNTRNLKQTIAVYDFGGGTFDITILKLHDQVYEVLGTAGDTFLGGDDLDERLVDKMVGKFLQENRIDLRTNEVSMMRLRAVAEQTKIELSRRSRAVVRVDEIAYGPKGAPLNLQIEITRDEFVSQVSDIIDRTFPVCKEALRYAGLDIDRIDDVILVGGTTKIPYVRDQVSKFFAKAARTDVNPEDAVAVGASLQARALEQILSRKSSRRIPIVTAPDDEAFSGETNTVDNTVDNLLAGSDVEMDDEET